MREGSLTGARVRPDGTVWYRLQRGEHPGVVYEVGRERADPRAAAARAARPAVTSRGSTRTRTASACTAGSSSRMAPKPWPTLMFIHGGPTSVDLDRWSPEVQAYVDMGFCVAMLNYRGSIGFGAAWRDALIGNIGWPEVEDIVAGHDDLDREGHRRPRAIGRSRAGRGAATSRC